MGIRNINQGEQTVDADYPDAGPGMAVEKDVAHASGGSSYVDAAETIGSALSISIPLLPTVFLSSKKGADQKEWILPPAFEKYRLVLEKGIESVKDLKQVEKFLTEVSPQFAGRLIQAVREKIPIQLNADGSAAFITRASILDRNSPDAWATEITLKKKASGFDVIHEYTHAVPGYLLQEILNPSPAINEIFPPLDRDQETRQLVAALVERGKREEGLAFGSEPRLIEDFKEKGIIPPRDEQERKLDDAYERGGIRELALNLTTILPSYLTRFRIQSIVNTLVFKLDLDDELLANDMMEAWGVKEIEEKEGRKAYEVDWAKFLQKMKPFLNLIFDPENFEEIKQTVISNAAMVMLTESAEEKERIIFESVVDALANALDNPDLLDKLSAPLADEKQDVAGPQNWKRPPLPVLTVNPFLFSSEVIDLGTPDYPPPFPNLELDHSLRVNKAHYASADASRIRRYPSAVAAETGLYATFHEWIEDFTLESSNTHFTTNIETLLRYAEQAEPSLRAVLYDMIHWRMSGFSFNQEREAPQGVYDKHWMGETLLQVGLSLIRSGYRNEADTFLKNALPTAYGIKGEEPGRDVATFSDISDNLITQIVAMGELHLLLSFTRTDVPLAFMHFEAIYTGWEILRTKDAEKAAQVEELLNRMLDNYLICLAHGKKQRRLHNWQAPDIYFGTNLEPSLAKFIHMVGPTPTMASHAYQKITEWAEVKDRQKFYEAIFSLEPQERIPEELRMQMARDWKEYLLTVERPDSEAIYLCAKALFRAGLEEEGLSFLEEKTAENIVSYIKWNILLDWTTQAPHLSDQILASARMQVARATPWAKTQPDLGRIMNHEEWGRIVLFAKKAKSLGEKEVFRAVLDHVASYQLPEKEIGLRLQFLYLQYGDQPAELDSQVAPLYRRLWADTFYNRHTFQFYDIFEPAVDFGQSADTSRWAIQFFELAIEKIASLQASTAQNKSTGDKLIQFLDGVHGSQFSRDEEENRAIKDQLFTTLYEALIPEGNIFAGDATIAVFANLFLTSEQNIRKRFFDFVFGHDEEYPQSYRHVVASLNQHLRRYGELAQNHRKYFSSLALDLHSRLIQRGEITDPQYRGDVMATITDEDEQRRVNRALTETASSIAIPTVYVFPRFQDIERYDPAWLKHLLYSRTYETAVYKVEYSVSLLGSSTASLEVKQAAFNNLVLAKIVDRYTAAQQQELVNTGNRTDEEKLYQLTHHLWRYYDRIIPAKERKNPTMSLPKFDLMKEIFNLFFQDPALRSTLTERAEEYTWDDFDQKPQDLADLILKAGFVDLTSFNPFYVVRLAIMLALPDLLSQPVSEDNNFRESTDFIIKMADEQEKIFDKDEIVQKLSEYDSRIARRVKESPYSGFRVLEDIYNLPREERMRLLGLISEYESLSPILADRAKYFDVPTPEIFRDEPELLQFLVRRYFIYMDYSQREQLLRNFKGVSKADALKTFFELTGLQKVGQFLASWPQTPENIKEKLRVFEDQVEASDISDVQHTLIDPLDRKKGEAIVNAEGFRLIKAGTIGEVYEFKMDGKEYVVKLISRQKKQEILKVLARAKMIKEDLKMYGKLVPGGWAAIQAIEAFEEMVRRELDFREEYRNAEEFRAKLAAVPGFSIPKYRADYVAEEVLVQEKVKGVKITDVRDLTRRHELTDRLKALMLFMVNEGLIHTDLHPGNLYYDETTDAVGLLDFGQVLRLTNEEIEKVKALTMAVTIGLSDKIVSALLPLHANGAGIDAAALKTLVAKVVQKHAGDQNQDQAFVDMVSEIFAGAGSTGLHIQSTYTKLLKAFTSLAGTASELVNGKGEYTSHPRPALSIGSEGPVLGLTEVETGFPLAGGTRGGNDILSGDSDTPKNSADWWVGAGSARAVSAGWIFFSGAQPVVFDNESGEEFSTASSHPIFHIIGASEEPEPQALFQIVGAEAEKLSAPSAVRTTEQNTASILNANEPVLPGGLFGAVQGSSIVTRSPVGLAFKVVR